jgi:hypothetical protein
MSLHLHPVETPPVADPAPRIEKVFFVIQRSNGHWSPAAKITHVMEQEWQAEDMAAKLKSQHPQQHYGVAVLCSEAHTVAHPIEIVRTEGNA